MKKFFRYSLSSMLGWLGYGIVFSGLLWIAVNVSGDSTRLSAIFPSDKFIPLQYMGLKDKNGREIYEGDILRFEDSKLIQVVFVDCSARFAGVPLDTEKYGSAEWTIDEKRYEIVGNIYENLELVR